MPMGAPEVEECFFTSAIRTGYTVQIDLHIAAGYATLGEHFRQAFGPFRRQLPGEDNLGPISQIEDRGAKHHHCKCSFLTNLRWF
jgi:hypothetical protein